MQAAIIAGGIGARLKSRIGDTPKPIADICGKPLLARQLELLLANGFTDVVIFLHHGADAIKDTIGDGGTYGVRIRYIVERAPSGTAGGILASLSALDYSFLVLYGDVMVNADLRNLWQTHEYGTCDATIVLHPNNHPLDSDLVEVDALNRITAFHNRPHPPQCSYRNLVSAGAFVINNSALSPLSAMGNGAAWDFGSDVFPALLAGNSLLAGYRSAEYFRDIGTPERYDSVCADFASCGCANSRKAVFIDRDGTICKDGEPNLFPGSAEAIRRLNRGGYRVVVVTNQPGVAKGLFTEQHLEQIHGRIEMELGAGGAYLDRIYYCPHHPDGGFPGERKELKTKCMCRKPSPGMIVDAASDLNIDLSQSWLIGDSTTDIQTAKNAGLKSILVLTGRSGADGVYVVDPDHVCPTLEDAVSYIL